MNDKYFEIKLFAALFGMSAIVTLFACSPVLIMWAISLLF